jgi:hypothetical protein
MLRNNIDKTIVRITVVITLFVGVWKLSSINYGEVLGIILNWKGKEGAEFLVAFQAFNFAPAL